MPRRPKTPAAPPMAPDPSVLVAARAQGERDSSAEDENPYPVARAFGIGPMPLDPAAPVTLTHTVGGLSVEVPPIVREESAERWGYVPPSDDVVMPVGGVYPAVPLPDFIVTQVVQATAADVEHVIVEMRRPPTPEEAATRILAEDPRTALALYRRVSRGHGLAEWRPLGAGAQLVDLGTGDMLALVAPEGRGFRASYVESGTNLAGPTADTLEACKDAVANRMRARGVGVL